MYHSDQQGKRLYPISVPDCAIHFWRKGLPGPECSRNWTVMRGGRYPVAIQASQMSLATSLSWPYMKFCGTMSTQSLVRSQW